MRAREGDAHAMRFLFSTYSARVHRYATSIVSDADLAQDITQTTFLKLLTKLDRYEPRSAPFEAWLMRVTRNVALDELRRRQATSGREVRDEDQPPRPGPDNHVLPAALRRVPSAQRRVLVMRHVLGLSTPEIAERLGLSEAAVEALHEAGRRHLRSALVDLEGTPVSEPRLRTRTRPGGAQRPTRHVRLAAGHGRGPTVQRII